MDLCGGAYTGTLHMINRAPLEPYRRTMPRAPWWSQGGVLFPMSEVPLYLPDVLILEKLSLSVEYAGLVPPQIQFVA